MRQIHFQTILFAATLFVTLSVPAQVTLSIDDLKMRPGETKEISINLINGNAGVFNLEGKIILPEGFSFVKGYEEGTMYMTSTNRLTGFDIVADVMEEGYLYFVVYTMGTTPIPNELGAILKCTIKADIDVSIGDKEIRITDVVMSDMMAEPFVEYATFSNGFMVYSDNNNVCATVTHASTPVVSLNGTEVRSKEVQSLPAGMYIVRGKKVLIK